MSLAEDTRLLAETVLSLDKAVVDDDWDDLDQGLVCAAMLAEVKRDLSISLDELMKKLAEKMPESYRIVDGVGQFKRHRKSKRTKWDREALLSAVLDSRLVDRDGVPADENPLEKVLHVWLLGTPRITALRERHIDADQFCETEPGSLTLEMMLND